MRFSFEIPDDLFHATSTVPTQASTDNQAVHPAGGLMAIPGGAAPEQAAATAGILGAASAGSAEEYRLRGIGHDWVRGHRRRSGQGVRAFPADRVKDGAPRPSFERR